ncbi:amino acid adenylation domain-containing protein [Actinokineospora guangxiensis]|uniref:Amino acid adenylation domain-containing protein n=1 Tax=Actinokineospora guangxiensis TaxID=1490288 RepID=A0ABW0ERM2_9PSEU
MSSGEKPIREWLLAAIAKRMPPGSAAVPSDTPLADLGLSSRELLEVTGELSELVGRELDPAALWKHPTVDAIAAALSGARPAAGPALPEGVPRAVETEGIAVVGMAARFPGGVGIDAFWELVRQAATPAPVAPPGRPHGDRQHLLADVESFAAPRFGLRAEEAELMDPQQRVVMEVAWEALQDAGIPVGALRGTRTGVFVGASSADFARLVDAPAGPARRYAATGSSPSILANRLSYAFGLHGPSMTVDTACSSSLVALHLACQAIRLGECDAALVGGVNVILDDAVTDTLRAGQMISPSGACRTFDRAADGYVRSEGCGVVVLKPLSSVTGSDTVLGIIRGTAVAQDGRSNGLTAPNPAAQQTVVRDALRRAGVRGDQLSYVECHGTGTPLGDPIEVEALDAVLSRDPTAPPCAISSVKAVVGHCEAAAGIAGLIKLLLQGRHGLIAAHPVSSGVAPRVAECAAVVVPDVEVEWPPGQLAGVSSFGFGGTLAHAIVETAPVAAPVRPAARSAHLFVLSADNRDDIRDLAARTLAFAEAHPGAAVADLAHTLTSRRSRLTEGLAFVAGAADLADRLREIGGGSGESDAGAARWFGERRDGLVFGYGGQVADVARLGRGLYTTLPEYRARLRDCADVLGALGVPLLPGLFTGHPDDRTATTAFIQPALVAHQIALSGVWLDWGLSPRGATGYSVGEIAAACTAGALTVEEALRLAVARGAVMERYRGRGATVSVRIPVSATATPGEVAPDCPISAVNSARHVHLAVPAHAIEATVRDLREAGLRARLVNPAYAFHSPLMGSPDELRDLLGETPSRPVQIPLVSTSTGSVVRSGEVLPPDHWVRHALAPVCWHAALAGIGDEFDGPVVVEFGAITHLATSVAAVPGVVHVGTTATVEHDVRAVLTAVAAVASAGQDVTGVERGGALVSAPAPAMTRQRLRSRWSSRSPGPEQTARVNDPPADAQAIAHHAPVRDARRRENPMTSPDAVVTAIAAQLDLPPGELHPDVTFLDQGADSFALIRLIEVVKTAYGREIELSELFDRLNTPRKLAQRLIDLGVVTAAEDEPAAIVSGEPEAAALTRGPESAEPGTDASALIKEFLATHERVMASAAGLITGRAPDAPAVTRTTTTRSAPPASRTAPLARAGMPTADNYTPAQRTWFNDLVRRYTEHTAGSRALADEGRVVHADLRNAPGAHPELARTRYPLAAKSADGSSMTDVDGHTYVDLTMGFGCYLFGNNPPLVAEAIQRELAAPGVVGPQSEPANRVARKLCAMTGHERAVFCNTGSEAVMLSLRLARAATGRRTVVVFEGSYHGAADSVARVSAKTMTGPLGDRLGGIGGDEVLLLRYGAEASLGAIAERAEEIAAVLVEPVQSRMPGHQPAEFCRALRELTARHGVVLVFDEVLTGFRSGLTGVQGRWGVRPDLAVYGKVLGAGLPIGVVAGSTSITAALDGANGHDGALTFFSGTYCKHPYSLVVADAVLTELEQRGAPLLAELDERTARLARRVNQGLARISVPIRISWFGSLFRFEFTAEHPYSVLIEAFYLALTLRGVYVWEGRNCFLSSAHTDADLARIEAAVIEVGEELAAQGFFGQAPPVAAGECEPGAVSAVQERFWVLQAASPSSSAYSVTTALDLDHPIDVRLFQTVCREVLGEFELLHATFAEKDDRVVVVPRPPDADPALHVVDLRELPVTETAGGADAGTESVVDSVVDAVDGCVFDLREGPLYRMVLVLRPDGRVTCVLSCHHIVCDQRSLEQIATRFVQALRGDGEPLRLPGYDRYVAMEERRRADGTWDRATGYWRGQLAGVDIGSTLTEDGNPRLESSEAGTLTGSLDAATATALRAWSRRNGLTPFMAQAAVLAMTLSRLTGSSAVTFGTQVDDRFGSAADAFGPMINTLALRLDVERGCGPDAVAAHVRSVCLAALTHRALPFQEVVRRLGPPRRRGRHPFFQICMQVLTPFEDSVGDVAGARLRAVKNKHPKFELQFDVYPTRDRGIDAVALYDRTRLSDERMAEFLAVWKACAQELAGMGTTDDADQSRELLHGGFETTARATPLATAVRHGDLRWSYADVDRLADGLRLRCSLGAGERVALVLDRSDPWIVPAMIAVLRSGATAVPLDAEWPTARIADLLAQAGCRTVVSTAAHRARATIAAGTADLVIADDGTEYREVELAPVAVDPSWPAYVIFTSGSTGKPKGVVVPHRSVASRMAWQRSVFPLSPGESAVLTFSPSFDAAVWLIFGPLSDGGCCVLLGRGAHGDPATLTRALVEHRCPVLKTVPAMLSLLLETDGVDALAGTLRSIACGGEELDGTLYRRCAEHLPGVRLYNMYGPTEATISALHWAGELKAGPTPLGTPVVGATAHIVDDALDVVPDGEQGEICLGGGALALGYLDDPRATAQRFLPDPHGAPGTRLYATGDTGSRRAGEFHFAGRKDRQVQVRGHRVELDEVERVMRSVLGASGVVVTKAGDTLHATVRLDPSAGSGFDWPSIRGKLVELLPSYAVPSRCELVDRLPEHVSGKTDLRGVAERPDAARTPELVRSEVHDIWAALLGHTNFGEDDDFFLAGGHSLLAVRLITTLNLRFGSTLELADLFEHGTLRELAELLAAGDSTPPLPPPDQRVPQLKPARRRRVRR